MLNLYDKLREIPLFQGLTSDNLMQTAFVFGVFDSFPVEILRRISVDLLPSASARSAINHLSARSIAILAFSASPASRTRNVADMVQIAASATAIWNRTTPGSAAFAATFLYLPISVAIRALVQNAIFEISGIAKSALCRLVCLVVTGHDERGASGFQHHVAHRSRSRFSQLEQRPRILFYDGGVFGKRAHGFQLSFVRLVLIRNAENRRGSRTRLSRRTGYVGSRSWSDGK